jgi:ribonuclease III family protein
MESEQEPELGFKSDRALQSVCVFSDWIDLATKFSDIAPAQLQRLSPAALAYVGDAVYELYVRTHYLVPPRRLRAYHDRVVAQVRAESQAQHLRSLHPYFTEAELEIIRRGRNAAPRRLKRVDPEIYQQASSLETLLGYLYITDPQRLAQLLEQLQLEIAKESNSKDMD